MTDQHPITPPPIVREQWQLESPFKVVSLEREDYMIDRAAQWGADRELEACCEWVRDTHFIDLDGHDALRTARRPKPPSLKAQALALIDSNIPYLDDAAMGTIRRALEALND